MTWLGTRMFGSHGLKPVLLGVVLWRGRVGGSPLPDHRSLDVLVGLEVDAAFRHGLLIPGVVVSKDSSTTVVGLADLGKSPRARARSSAWPARTCGACRITRTRSGPASLASRISMRKGRDRFFYFSPYPVSHGTGDPFDLEQCVQRLGEASFRRIEGLIARGLTPEHWNRMVVVDANDEVIETRGYMEAGEMSSADRKQHASPQQEEAKG